MPELVHIVPAALSHPVDTVWRVDQLMRFVEGASGYALIAVFVIPAVIRNRRAARERREALARSNATRIAYGRAPRRS